MIAFGCKKFNVINMIVYTCLRKLVFINKKIVIVQEFNSNNLFVFTFNLFHASKRFFEKHREKEKTHRCSLRQNLANIIIIIIM